ncbi:hypothetical protein WN72_10490 [Bradyrhizobium arachidis]|uniref:Uncharacterized protein n=1 Tax=Bradyrhizobium arachidis TaxID=858423 RepID=A0AAE7NQA8_9BRAD|nr:hypothetical protein WN72_10490 [Bradyrhizobium arachidis]
MPCGGSILAKKWGVNQRFASTMARQGNYIAVFPTVGHENSAPRRKAMCPCTNADVSPFLKLLWLFIIEQSPKLAWRKRLWLESTFFWINGNRRSEVIIPESVKRVVQVLFQLPQLLWRDGDRRVAGLIIEMIQHSPEVCLRELLRIGCDLLLDESRGGGLIISPPSKLLCVFILEQSPNLRWRELV